MTKIQQKISGCFRSLEEAHIFCSLLGNLSTCWKHGMKITEVLKILFEGYSLILSMILKLTLK